MNLEKIAITIAVVLCLILVGPWIAILLAPLAIVGITALLFFYLVLTKFGETIRLRQYPSLRLIKSPRDFEGTVSVIDVEYKIVGDL